ncbi:beta-N-acetylhexosaminidase [Paenibacillus sp. SI8]|uniref:beta-N-acetylhexosaminidase n=1 Tax=unclassified Paenibacillus TaxID=185978 RepID=UPI0034664F48
MRRFAHILTKWSLWSSVSMLLLTGCFGGAASSRSSLQASERPTSPIAASAPAADAIQAKLQAMSAEEKIGQLIFAGIDGTDMNLHTRELIETYHVGGIILYKSNVKNTIQLASLADGLKHTNIGNKLPLWLGVDEEGGKVTRLPDDIEKTPSNKEIGRMGSTEFAYGVGSMLGKELSAYGLNVDFAPVLDINSNPKNPVIGERSYGANASIVSRMGIQTMKGLRDQHVMPVVKHFPGHGDTSVDSHVGLPIVQHDVTRLRKLELVPFAEAIKNQAEAVMVAHILLPTVDAQHPSSMSKKIMTDLLRQEMGFQGLIITDDMTMGAITTHNELGEASVTAVLAGADVVLVGHDYDKAVTVIGALRKAVQDKRIPMDTIDQSVERIMQLKMKYQLKDDAVPAPDSELLNDAVRRLVHTYLHK